MLTESRAVRAIGGGPLVGDRLVYVIYLDETGHDKKNKIVAVAGVVLNPDKQWVQLANGIEELKARVPEQHRDGFIFHATDLYYRGG